MRDNWLSNRVFGNHSDMIDHRCDAWNKLEAQPWAIMSIGLRDLAHADQRVLWDGPPLTSSAA
jgi:hypothetical protein